MISLKDKIPFLGTQRCRNKIDFKLSRIDCCCGEGVGVAWGEGKTDCDQCPKKGSAQHDDLCKAAHNIIDSTGCLKLIHLLNEKASK